MDNAEQQLSEELARGTKAARALAKHAHRMGAGGLTTPPIRVADHTYTITVTRTPGTSSTDH